MISGGGTKHIPPRPLPRFRRPYIGVYIPPIQRTIHSGRAIHLYSFEFRSRLHVSQPIRIQNVKEKTRINLAAFQRDTGEQDEIERDCLVV